MALQISRGIVPSAQKVVIYGVEGIGKSTLASKFPDPLFIDTEGSTKHMDVARLAAPKSWSELLSMIGSVKAEKPCKTLVIDTIDWAERLAAAQVVAEANNPKVKSIEDFGYGAGYTKLVEEFSRLLDRLADVADSGINVVLVAHADIRKFEQPDEAASYDRWELKLTKSGQKKVAPIVKEWADAVLFMNFKTIVESVSSGMGASKGKARGGQKRVMYATHHACWDAKNRWGLDGELEVDWSVIEPYIPKATPESQPEAAHKKNSAWEEAEKAEAQLKEIVSKQKSKEPQKPPAFEEVTEEAPPSPENRAAPLYELQGLPAYWEPALRLMDANEVSMAEIMALIGPKDKGGKGFFSADTPPEKIPKDFIDGCLVPQWEQTLKNIQDMRVAQEPLPFS